MVNRKISSIYLSNNILIKRELNSNPGLVLLSIKKGFYFSSIIKS